MKYGKPASVYSVLANLAEADLRIAKSKLTKERNEAPILKAKCKRLAGRTIVVNNTVFSFDDEGVCSAPDVGDTRTDFRILLKMNGVTEVVETVEEQPTPAAEVKVPDPAPVKKEEKAPAPSVRSAPEVPPTPKKAPAKKPEAAEEPKPKKRGRPRKKKD